MNKKGVLIVGGGTGGHISPGLALLEQFNNEGIPAYILVSKRDQRFSYLKQVDQKQLLFYGPPVFSKNLLKFPNFCYQFGKALFFAKKIIKKNNIVAVCGMGGYVSAPALLAAKFKKKKIFLCEQNGVPGKVTQMFSADAENIFSTFKSSDEQFKEKVRDKIMVTGNPVRNSVLSFCSQKQAKKRFNVEHCQKVLLIIGGSQGALSINKAVLEMKKKFSSEFENVGVIWAAGERSYEQFKKEISLNNLSGSVYLTKFIDNIGDAYAAADLVISRAGSGVMMELAAAAVPSVLIPYPYAAGNHQDKNADDFVLAGASIKIVDNKLQEEKEQMKIIDLLHDNVSLDRMAKACATVAKQNAATDIVAEIARQIK